MVKGLLSPLLRAKDAQIIPRNLRGKGLIETEEAEAHVFK